MRLQRIAPELSRVVTHNTNAVKGAECFKLDRASASVDATFVTALRVISIARTASQAARLARLCIPLNAKIIGLDRAAWRKLR